MTVIYPPLRFLSQIRTVKTASLKINFRLNNGCNWSFCLKKEEYPKFKSVQMAFSSCIEKNKHEFYLYKEQEKIKSSQESNDSVRKIQNTKLFDLYKDEKSDVEGKIKSEGKK